MAMAPHSSNFAWKIPWMEEAGGLQSMESLESDTTERFHFHFSLSCIREGNGNPLQCSCLENPRDGEAWWAAVYGVAQSQTQLKQLSSSSSSRPFLNLLYWLIFLLTMDHIFLFLYVSYNFSVNFEHYNRFNFVFLQIVKHFVLSEVNLWIHLIFPWLLSQV